MKDLDTEFLIKTGEVKFIWSQFYETETKKTNFCSGGDGGW